MPALSASATLTAMVCILVGAFLGGMARYGLARSLRAPVGTFAANILGACAIGAAIGFYRAAGLSEPFYALCVTGFAGGLSTWSTLAKELGQMVRAREYQRCLKYLFFTVAVGMVAAWRCCLWAGRIYQAW
ncbi:CrcB family protein [uncultured Corynebacterium sp.]|uniref:FluC/FEX family fluoride channel n=1 Tax=uncultured Corynebacterium sp. TaxID=159447 RepID=UPI0025EEB921|nr:CrcB family protein [uncultured Corynebacterium sp.]